MTEPSVDVSSDGGRRHVFAIGAATYDDDAWENLAQVPRDVLEVIATLAGFGYRPPVDRPEGLIDPPSRQDLELAFDSWLSTECAADDTLIVYHAGHGADEEPHHLVCRTTSPGPMVRITGVPTSRLVELPGDRDVRRLLVIVDTCFAADGAVDAMAGEAVRTLAARRLAQTAKDQLVGSRQIHRQRRLWDSLAILSAARCGEAARDGAFAQALVKVLREQVVQAPILVRERPVFVPLEEVVRAINLELDRSHIPQRADLALIHSGDLSFFPNPHHIPGLPERTDLAESRVRAQHRRPGVDRELFARLGAAVDTHAADGHFFTGRTRVMTRLARWLRGDDEAHVRVFQIAGGPGVGKSSLLGRVVTLADGGVRDRIPDTTVVRSTDVRPEAIDLAIHAAGKTPAQILASFANALESTATERDQILTMLATGTEPLTVVVDSLDEAGNDAEHAAIVAEFLHEAAVRAPRLRLILGGRPHIFPTALRRPPHVAHVDLDDEEWTEREDIVAYAAQLLREPHGPGSATGLPDRAVRYAAMEIAEVTYPNHLTTRLIARALAHPDRAFWRADRSSWPSLLPPSTGNAIGAAFRWAMETQLGPEETHRARALLLPLAHAQGDGLPLGDLWPQAAGALVGAGVTSEEISRLLESEGVAPYVLENIDRHGRSVYRLYHSALAEELRLYTGEPSLPPQSGVDLVKSAGGPGGIKGAE